MIFFISICIVWSAILLLYTIIDAGDFWGALGYLLLLISFVLFLFAEVLRQEKTPETLPKTGEINPFSLNNNANNLR